MKRRKKSKNKIVKLPEAGRKKFDGKAEEVLQKLEEAFLFGCTDEEACLYADISPSTLYNYQNENPEFLERKNLLKQNQFLHARNCLLQGVKEDPELALKFLERKKKDEFSPKFIFEDDTDNEVEEAREELKNIIKDLARNTRETEESDEK